MMILVQHTNQPHLRSSAACPMSRSGAAADASQGNQAAFREEVVCVLVETLLSHPQGVIRGLEPLEQEDGEAASLARTMKQAARAQSAGAIADWLGTAKIALQVPVTIGLCCHLPALAKHAQGPREMQSMSVSLPQTR